MIILNKLKEKARDASTINQQKKMPVSMTWQGGLWKVGHLWSLLNELPDADLSP